MSKCSFCNETINFGENGFKPLPTNPKDYEKWGLCFSCMFWAEVRNNYGHGFGKNFVVKSCSYLAYDSLPYSEGGPYMRGCGGAHKIIQFEDGSVISTTNMWCQGEIPKIWRELLSDNAVFIDREGTGAFKPGMLHVFDLK